ncbi:tyrosine-type recombinase/integrase [Streptomyces sp. NPDC058301]|uniref:tyrosine-type recombinase/integrase n=1 Tax=Streptomyces sp. NPDC058301 TaxID=3346436 RepID=UPI0036E711C2
MSGTMVLMGKWPVLGRHEHAAVWLRIWTDLGRAPRTIDAYAPGLAEYLVMCEREGVDPVTANRAHIAVYVRELMSRPHRRGGECGGDRLWGGAGQRHDPAAPGAGPPVDAVCLLDVPTHKTGTAFTKAVDPILGQAVDAFQAARPDQPKFTDRRTGELVDPLFAVRARRVSTSYINNTIIPMLCRKAGVPAVDVRGNITSHRARSTIASQLYNAKEPMTLFELQAWLGHRSRQSTQYYAKITPNTLSKAYSEAGYFERNVRTIEVLVDRDAVASGAAAASEPWQHYDLGHGYCSYTFFEQCQHRMACARCDFYTPKASSKSQLLEAKENLQKMLVAIPLTDDERAAVDDGQAALDQLLERLTDTPTPAGPTPRQIGVPATSTLLPIVNVTARPREHGPGGPC